MHEQRFQHVAARLARVLLWSVMLALCGCGILSRSNGQVAAAESFVPSGATPAAQANMTSRCAAVTSSPASKGAAKGTAKANVDYDQKTNTITVRKGKPATLGAVSRALGNAKLLGEVAPGEWLLNANLTIEKGGALQIASPEVRWLKLKSDGGGFVFVKALGGDLDITGACVTSWDESQRAYDKNYDDGRSFVLARDGAQMRIRDSELSYLGYLADESYGLAWRTSGTSGEIVNSTLGYNFYGLYTYKVSGLVVRNNEVHHSVRYGIDPHTKSTKLLIEGNISHHNGKHGIILAEGCTDSIIRNNITYNNTMHGIVLYQKSDNNRVENNTSYGNGYEGINVNDSSESTISGNTVYENVKAGIGVQRSAKKNVVANNTVRGNRDGISLYSKASKNTVQNNEVHGNKQYGIQMSSKGNRGEGNRVFDNSVGVYLAVDEPNAVSLKSNQIYNNRDGDVREKS